MSGRPGFMTLSAPPPASYDGCVNSPPLNASHPALQPALAAGLSSVAAEQLLAFYDEPHRHYHSREHLREMFGAALDYDLKLSAAQALAVLAHDAVYVPGAAPGSNEAMSAQLLKCYAAGVSASILDAAVAIVHDTTDHEPRSREAAAVLDLDLMRLGAEPEAFERHSREVFDEQRPLITLADEAAAWHWFDQRRARFFELLLERPAIYQLAPMRSAYEARCRANLSAVVSAAKAAGTAIPSQS